MRRAVRTTRRHVTHRGHKEVVQVQVAEGVDLLVLRASWCMWMYVRASERESARMQGVNGSRAARTPRRHATHRGDGELNLLRLLLLLLLLFVVAPGPLGKHLGLGEDQALGQDAAAERVLDGLRMR